MFTSALFAYYIYVPRLKVVKLEQIAYDAKH